MQNPCSTKITISSIVPYIHVADVARSISFYESVGMECRTQMGPPDRPYWASMAASTGQLMLAQADGPIDPRTQAGLFYLYTPDLATLRGHLIEQGLRDGGIYVGEEEDDYPASGVVFAIKYPPYLPTGEMRVHDPDGYVLQFAISVDSVRS